MRTRTYSELVQFTTFEERFEYLSVRAIVGATTFGGERYLNQQFYRSYEWKRVRNYVIARDNGCDLGVEGYEIHDQIYIHHMNPITVQQVEDREESILDPKYLISTTHRTHNAIHYGSAELIPKTYKPRTPGDTKLW